tara:strand:+ start:530 stop:844 length:315 start_codon:yes stop_codon:yes gene_type:complete
VALPTVAVDLDQALYILSHFSPKITLYNMVTFYNSSNTQNFIVCQIANHRVQRYISLLANFYRCRVPYAIYIWQRELDLLIAWDVHACDTSHARLLEYPLISLF